MTEQPKHTQREALIATGLDRPLSRSESAELALLADVLGHPSTWAEPNAGLEDAVIKAVADVDADVIDMTKPRARRASSRRRRSVLSAVAAVAAAAVVTVGVGSFRGAEHADFAAVLTGTPLAPRAHAESDAYKSSAGFRITLEPSNLPRLHHDEYYQVWLKNAAGTLIPVGTFSSSRGKVTLWSGMSPKDYPEMTVSIERTNNDQLPSGRRVLMGTVHAT